MGLGMRVVLDMRSDVGTDVETDMGTDVVTDLRTGRNPHFGSCPPCCLRFFWTAVSVHPGVPRLQVLDRGVGVPGTCRIWLELTPEKVPA